MANKDLQDIISQAEGLKIEFKKAENKIYPFLYESDFAEDVVDRVRRIIRIYRPNHTWNELSNENFYKTAGLYRKDMASGKEGFTMSALLLFGKPETISSAIVNYKIY